MSDAHWWISNDLGQTPFTCTHCTHRTHYGDTELVENGQSFPLSFTKAPLDSAHSDNIKHSTSPSHSLLSFWIQCTDSVAWRLLQKQEVVYFLSFDICRRLYQTFACSTFERNVLSIILLRHGRSREPPQRLPVHKIVQRHIYVV